MLPLNPEMLRPLIGTALANPQVRAEILIGLEKWLAEKGVRAVEIEIDDGATVTIPYIRGTNGIAKLVLNVIAGEIGFLIPDYPYPFKTNEPDIIEPTETT
jgi:hypothetical protein